MAPDEKGAVERDSTIAFLNELGFSECPSVRKTWASVGKTPVIRRHFNWKRIGAIGVIACSPDGSCGRILIHLEPSSIHKEIVVESLVRLRQEIDGPVDLLWDGLPDHRSKIVKDHIASSFDWLQVHRFPAYAPELNPVEYMWSLTKGKDVANLCSDYLYEVEHKARQTTQRLNCQEQTIRGFLVASTLYGHSILVTVKGETR